jgi:hypothetical protein
VGSDGRIAKQQGEVHVIKAKPHLGDNGMGVNGPALREDAGALPHSVIRQKPHLGDNGKGVNGPALREDAAAVSLTMPLVLQWMNHLSNRLRHVRICNGDWSRVCSSGAAKTLDVRKGVGTVGFFIDPPYGEDAIRTSDIYAVDGNNIASDVQEWCIKNGNDKDYRIVLSGFDGEHNKLETMGWTAREWYRPGHLKGGYGNGGVNGTSQHRERLWMSPHCLRPSDQAQVKLW